MEHGTRRRLSVRDSRAVHLGISVAVFAALSLIALIAVGIVNGQDSAGPPAPANTQEYLSQEQQRPLTSFDFIQPSTGPARTQNDDYPRSTDGLTLPQQTGR